MLRPIAVGGETLTMPADVATMSGPLVKQFLVNRPAVLAPLGVAAVVPLVAVAAAAVVAVAVAAVGVAVAVVAAAVGAAGAVVKYHP